MPPSLHSPPPAGFPPIHGRRRARNAVCLNAFTWALGNGLFSTSLIVYLVYDLCRNTPGIAVGTTIAWILALPRLVGVLRLAAPALIERSGNRKGFCIACYLIAAAILATIPVLLPCLLPVSASVGPLLALLIGTWGLYHLFQHFGYIALCAWVADLLTPEIRGRFFGMQEAAKLAGLIFGSLGAGFSTYAAARVLPPSTPSWTIYTAPACCGVACFILATLPLLSVPNTETKKASKIPKDGKAKTSFRAAFQEELRRIVHPLRVPGFALFLLFGCWLQLALGITQATERYFHISYMALPMLAVTCRESLTRFGQWTLGRLAGRRIDACGCRGPVSIALFCVATGSLCYAVIEPDSWMLIYVAGICWIFWVVVNVGIATTLLALAPPEERAASYALYFTATTLAFGLSTFLGGQILDGLCKNLADPIPALRVEFFCGYLLRLTAIPLFLWAVSRVESDKSR